MGVKFEISKLLLLLAIFALGSLSAKMFNSSFIINSLKNPSINFDKFKSEISNGHMVYYFLKNLF